MSALPVPPDSEFRNANIKWHLDKLLTDLKQAQEPLTNRETKILRGLLCDHDPKNIAWIGFGNNDSTTIGGDLSTIYDKIEVLLGANVKINSGNIRNQLRDRGYENINNINPYPKSS
jgi:hypothetical protein